MGVNNKNEGEDERKKQFLNPLDYENVIGILFRKKHFDEKTIEEYTDLAWIFLIEACNKWNPEKSNNIKPFNYLYGYIWREIYKQLILDGRFIEKTRSNRKREIPSSLLVSFDGFANVNGDAPCGAEYFCGIEEPGYEEIYSLDSLSKFITTLTKCEQVVLKELLKPENETQIMVGEKLGISRQAVSQHKLSIGKKYLRFIGIQDSLEKFKERYRQGVY